MWCWCVSHSWSKIFSTWWFWQSSCWSPLTLWLGTCADDEYQCANGNCVPESYRCDYINDCEDNSDELGCVCNLDFEFECLAGGCVNASWVCDGEQDCLEGSDEVYCPKCPEGSYQCANGNCVPESYRCDYFNDCEDNSDEVDGCVCNPSYEFECIIGGCVNATWVCDGLPDCLDGSDEAEDLCEFTPTTMAPGMFMNCVCICFTYGLWHSRLCCGITSSSSICWCFVLSWFFLTMLWCLLSSKSI